MLLSQNGFSKMNEKFLVNSIYRFLSISTVPSLVKCVNSKIKDVEFTKSAQYYCWLFQENPKFQNFINNEELDPEFTLGYLYFCFGKHISKGAEADVAMKVSAEYFNSKTSLKLLERFSLIDIDVNLSLILISKLDEIDFQYFSLNNDLSEFFERALEELEKQTFKNYFIHNLIIYNHIIALFKRYSNSCFYNSFMKFYKKDFEMIQEAITIYNHVDEITQEQMIDIQHQRNTCLEILIKELRNKNDALEIVDVLFTKGFFADEQEKKLVEYYLSFVNHS
ncbi:MAG: hypothetical protein KDK36_01870 [Leptospiraceae bacterium]|nr:hypothetical protein [Leptospiraceae bacterium]